MMAVNLPLLNQNDATFECTFGRGCEGLCCREGRPPVYPDELERLTQHLDRFLPRMRPAARRAVIRGGFTAPRQRRLGQAMLRVAEGWCVFFHNGCVLHDAGVEDGDKFLFKPSLCSLFPLQQDQKDQWYVRQHHYKNERWDLFCLGPANSTRPAVDSLQEELQLAKRFDDEQKRAETASVG